MLVVISDLHLVDGTAGGNNLPLEAFKEVFLCDIKSLAQDNNAKEIKIVLLGDTIDLLRTAKWFDGNFPLEDRPWGENGLNDLNKVRLQKGCTANLKSSKTEQRCKEILRDIIETNHGTFEFFKKIKHNFDPLPPKKIELIYVPGNHDRLINYYPSLRKKIVQVLDPTIDEITAVGDLNSKCNWRFRNSYASEKYGILARHGHKFDKWNYAGSCRQVPMGDVITTEIVGRIPSLFRREMENKINAMAAFISPYEKSRIEATLDAEIAVLTEEIDNIRPLTSIFLYLRRKSGKFKKLEGHGNDYSEALNCTLCKVLRDFWRIPFVKKWLWQPRNLRTVGNGLIEVAREWAASRRGLIPDPSRDRFSKDAQRDYNKSNKDKKIPFILYGHTHSPL